MYYRCSTTGHENIIDLLAIKKILCVFSFFLKDGTFLLRKSKKGGPDNPYTLVVWFAEKCWNLKIRQRTDNKYAIGTIKEDENVRVKRKHPNIVVYSAIIRPTMYII